MVLADTSVWIDHLRYGDAQFALLLNAESVVLHPFVIGELACGRLSDRREVLSNLDRLPSATIASHDEVLAFVEIEGLFGQGIGWVDVHLLASARLGGLHLLTRDRALRLAAGRLGIAWHS